MMWRILSAFMFGVAVAGGILQFFMIEGDFFGFIIAGIVVGAILVYIARDQKSHAPLVALIVAFIAGVGAPLALWGDELKTAIADQEARGSKKSDFFTYPDDANLALERFLDQWEVEQVCELKVSRENIHLKTWTIEPRESGTQDYRFNLNSSRVISESENGECFRPMMDLPGFDLSGVGDFYERGVAEADMPESDIDDGQTRISYEAEQSLDDELTGQIIQELRLETHDGTSFERREYLDGRHIESRLPDGTDVQGPAYEDYIAAFEGTDK